VSPETKDALLTAFILLAMPAALMTPIVILAGKMVALRSPPDQRAKIMTAIAYVGIVLLIIAAEMGDSIGRPDVPLWVEAIAPFALPLPSAAAVFYYLRADYRSRWVDTVDELADGVKAENDDWRVGLGVVLILLLAGVFRGLFKYFSQH